VPRPWPEHFHQLRLYLPLDLHCGHPSQDVHERVKSAQASSLRLYQDLFEPLPDPLSDLLDQIRLAQLDSRDLELSEVHRHTTYTDHIF